MKRKLLSTTLLAGCFIVCVAAFADLSGAWKGVLKGPDGVEYQLSYAIKIDGDKLTGTLELPQVGLVPLDKGKTDGTNFSFSVTVDNTEYPATGKYIAAGDSVSMDVNFEGTKTHATLTRPK